MNAELITKLLLEGKILQQYLPHLKKWTDIYLKDGDFYGEDGKLSILQLHLNTRTKPSYIIINNIDVPQPEKNKPNIGDLYYFTCVSHHAGWSCTEWTGSNHDLHRLSSGLIHLDNEAAIRHSKALLSFTARSMRNNLC
jgi:hypothetical protein